MKNYVQQGAILDHTAASAITGGDPVVMGDSVGIAVGDIDSGGGGSVAVEGVYQVTKASGTAWTQGDALDYDASAGAFDKDISGASGDVTGCAIAAADATSGATSGKVKLTNPGTAV